MWMPSWKLESELNLNSLRFAEDGILANGKDGLESLTLGQKDVTGVREELAKVANLPTELMIRLTKFLVRHSQWSKSSLW